MATITHRKINHNRHHSTLPSGEAVAVIKIGNGWVADMIEGGDLELVDYENPVTYQEAVKIARDRLDTSEYLRWIHGE